MKQTTNNHDEHNGANKDFSSVSPSARSLLLMKAYTDIPWAREAATLVGSGDEAFGLDFDHKDFWFWIRVAHFESRYKSIDRLLEHTSATNILELSSGYSFRGLAVCSAKSNAFYIDTDLPAVIANKQQMVAAMRVGELKGSYHLQSLNVLDEEAFSSTIQAFPPGPVTIVNEGLLMYLNLDEKVQLCHHIRQALQQRGGCWITADIYARRTDAQLALLPQSQKESQFLEQHKVEENKFEDFEAARDFFSSHGFKVEEEVVPDFSGLSVTQQLLQVLPESMRSSNQPPPRIQVSWMLTLQ